MRNPNRIYSLRGLGYRVVMRIAHRFNWHYAPIIGPLDDGTRLRWCQWCGMRDRVIEVKTFVGKTETNEVKK